MLSNQSENQTTESSVCVDQASIDTQLEQQIAKGQITLLTLKQCFNKNKQFPAMGNNISQIMQVSNENGGSRKLADIILRDQSLTSKILSIVNSSSYNQFGGEINTISRAVIILGLDQIQSLSLSIMVFEKLNKGPMAETLKSYACQSFLSAFFAKKLVEEIKSINSEEAFLASMFHNLGKQITLYFLPEEYTEISNLKIENELDEDVTCIEVLGLNFTDIGQYIAIELKLPKNIILGIQAKPKIIKERPTETKDYLGQLSSLTNEILESAACGDNDVAEQKLNQIIKRYQVSFVFDYEKIINMLTVLSQILLNYCGVLGINSDENTFCKNFINFVDSQQETEQET
jgi:eukaryotic-like serine/threonine-protein kinase